MRLIGMVNVFPKYISNKAIISYFIALISVYILYSQYFMEWYWFCFGVVDILMFFVLGPNLLNKWQKLSPKAFEKKIFIYTLTISIISMTFCYFMYIDLRGEPFEYDPSDGLGYHEGAVWFVECVNSHNTDVYWNWLKSCAFDDQGYPMYIGFLYRIIDCNIYITRLVKCLLYSFTCVLIYRFAYRNFGEQVARMAAVFCMLLPNAIFYSASHRKEMEMVFLTVWCVERFDNALRCKHFEPKNWILPLLLLLYLFMYRTVLGCAIIVSIAISIILTDKKIISKSKKIILCLLMLVIMGASIGGTIANQINEIYTTKVENKQGKDMEWRSIGNSFAKYAGAAIFAPLITTIPFPSMINVSEQHNQQRLNGGYFIKNVFSIFVIFSLIILIKNRQIREHLVLYVYTFSYLTVIALSNFAHSERFHFPALPFLMIMAAYGICNINKKEKKLANIWIYTMAIACIAWNWFKLAGRGVL